LPEIKGSLEVINIVGEHMSQCKILTVKDTNKDPILKGDVIFNFGKHKGRTVKDVLLNEPGYYNWMMEGDFPQQTKNVMSRIRLSMKSN